MGMDLNGESRSVWISIWDWPYVLRLAKMNGWKPRGTKAPAGWKRSRKGKWDKNYTLNEAQRVSPADAAALGAALEQALDDIPNEDVSRVRLPTIKSDIEEDSQATEPSPKNPVLWLSRVELEKMQGEAQRDCAQSPLEALSGPRKTIVREIIDLCKSGGFLIR